MKSHAAVMSMLPHTTLCVTVQILQMRPHTSTRWHDPLKTTTQLRRSRLEAAQSADSSHTRTKQLCFLLGLSSGPPLHQLWDLCVLAWVPSDPWVNVGYFSSIGSGAGVRQPVLPEEERLAFVLVSYCCCNQLPQTEWLKATQIYHTVL